MKNEFVLEVRNVSKSFSGVKVLHKVSMNVKRGEVHFVIGENGAGKSTLMKIISGVYQKDEGEIIFEGKPVTLNSIRNAQELGISIIHQEFNLLPHRTIGQNIYLGREPIKNKIIKSIDQKEIYARSKELLGFLGISIDPKTRVSSLGIAQQQMVEVAKALCFKSKVLIMDEPTATLTRNEIDKLFEMIRKLKGEGVSIIYISHRLEEYKQIADTLTVLRDGRMVGTLKAQDTSIDEIIKLMVGREIKDQYNRQYFEPGEEVLRVEGLSSYRFKDINFNVRRGEIVGLSGLVGAGRTEIAKSIFGYDPIESGNVYYYGKKYNKLTTSLTTKLKIGFIPENRKEEGVIIEMPIRHNIVHASLKRLFKYHLINNRIETETAKKYQRDLNIITTSINRVVKFLSGGNQQKTVVAKWICAECDFMIFDEPTRGIDVGARAEIYEIINKLVSQGKAVLLISSDMPELLGLCDRIYVMKDGRITAEFSKDEATQEKIMACCV